MTDRGWEWAPGLYCRECGRRGVFVLDTSDYDGGERDWCVDCDGALSIETDYGCEIRRAKRKSGSMHDLLERHTIAEARKIIECGRAMRRDGFRMPDGTTGWDTWVGIYKEAAEDLSND